MSAASAFIATIEPFSSSRLYTSSYAANVPLFF